MKVQAAIVALAISAVTINAAPVELEERGKFGSIGKALGVSGDKKPDGAGTTGSAYNKDSAGNLNAGLGLTAQMGMLGANGLTTQTNEDKNANPPAQRRSPKGTAGGKASSPPKTSTPATSGQSAGAAGGRDKAGAADYMNTAANTLGIANMGMGVWNADQGYQAQQNAQKRELPPSALLGVLGMGGGPSVGVSNSNAQQAGSGNVKGSGAKSGRRSLMTEALLESDGFAKRELPPSAVLGVLGMGGGPSIDVSKQNAQSAGNGNVHMSGAKSRRQLQDENDQLQRRLISFDHSSSNSQSAGNGNVVASGASSGGAPSNSDNLMAAMSAGSQKPKQKRDVDLAKRLLSFSDQNINKQVDGNGNVVASGASSGGVPSNSDILASSMQKGGGGKGGGKRDLVRRLVSVSSSDQNQQVDGNGNVHMSGAHSGASPQFMASLNPGTAGKA